MEQVDIAIVGGGIGGGALATSLARAGMSVVVLEKSTVYQDHVRGEWMAPWGVVELQALGLYDTVLANGAHHLSRHQSMEEDVPAEESELMTLDLAALVPGIRGPLCIGHPALCQLLIEEAARAGATVRRGVTNVRITAGDTPAVEYVDEGGTRRVSCRLIIGADGRASQVRRQAGIELHRDSTHHFFAGMLVEDANGWPEDLQAIGVEGDVHFLVFPQGGGRLRLYIGYTTEQASRFAGARGQQAFLDAFRLHCAPRSEHIASARPAGPCNGYPNEDTWAEAVYRPGVLLIGDAAGSNDPIIGQGLSITLRDVRLVRDALLGAASWSDAVFETYAAERTERMRRLRFTASIMSTLLNEFGPAARERRRRTRERQMQDPTLLMPLLAAFVGPENVSAETFDESTRTRMFSPA